MQRALDKQDSVQNFNINKMSRWIEFKHYPLLKVMKYNSSYANVSIKTFNKQSRRIGIPLSFTAEEYPNFNNTWPYSPRKWLIPYDKNDILLPIDYDRNWIIINIQQAGINN